MSKPVIHKIELSNDNLFANGVAGPKNTFLHMIEEAFAVEITRSKEKNTQVDLKAVDAKDASALQAVEALKQMIDKCHQQDGDLYQNDVTAIIKKVKKAAALPVETVFLTNKQDIVLVRGPNNKEIKAKTDNQRKLVTASQNNTVVFATGPAGTGKTYTAVALAVRALNEKKARKIILTRPAVEAGENLGFLPGDLKEKIDPYLRPLYDALEDMIPLDKLNYYMTNKIIEIAPLAYMRGRTLDNAFVILDEAQNTTPLQMKMFLTRIGKDAKYIVTGDLSQRDLPTKERSGLEQATALLANMKDIAHIQLTAEDNQRHPLVRKIAKAYDEDEARQPEQTPRKTANGNHFRPA